MKRKKDTFRLFGKRVVNTPKPETLKVNQEYNVTPHKDGWLLEHKDKKRL